MAKAPRLNFYGIKLTPREARVLARGAGYGSNPARCQGKTRKGEDYTWVPYSGKYLIYNGVPEKFQSHDLPQFYDQGIIAYDKKRKCPVWTELGARYLMRVARANPHIRFGNTAKYDRKERRLEKKRIREMKTSPCPFAFPKTKTF